MRAAREEVRRQLVPVQLADELRKRYAPIVRSRLVVVAASGSTCFDDLLLDVYLQGVLDGVETARRNDELVREISGAERGTAEGEIGNDR